MESGCCFTGYRPDKFDFNLYDDTKEYIEGSCQNNDYVEKYKSLGDNTNFFFKKTIYMVKKNG